MTLDDFLRGLVQVVEDGAMSVDSQLVILRWAPAIHPEAGPGWDVSPVIDVMMSETGDHALLASGDESSAALTLGATIVLVEGSGESARSSKLMVRQSSVAGGYDVHLDEPVVGVAKNLETASYGVVAYFEGFEDVLGPQAAV